MTSSECSGLGGIYQGNGSDCTVPCIGACCLPDGSCADAVTSVLSVMEQAIGAGINAKHSNEDAIAPFDRWIELYGDRIGLLGGIDVAGALVAEVVRAGATIVGIHEHMGTPGTHEVGHIVCQRWLLQLHVVPVHVDAP